MPRRPDPAFSAVLRNLMEARGFSQADLARELDTTPSQVSRWLRGLVVPSVASIDTIARCLHADHEFLERLAGWRANTVGSVQDTIDPQLAALYDAEHESLMNDLRGIPPAFWPPIMAARREAGRLAVQMYNVLDQISQPAKDELAAPDDAGRPVAEADSATANDGLELYYRVPTAA